MNLHNFSIIDQCWFIFLYVLFVFQIISNSYNMKHQRRVINNRAYVIKSAIVAYSIIIFIGVLYSYSSLMGNIFLAIALLANFLIYNLTFKESFYISTKRLIGGVGLGTILLFSISSVYAEVRWDLQPKTIGILTNKNEEKVIHFAEVDSVISWTKWYNALPRPIPIETVNQSLIKLEAICPVMLTDALLYITCCQKGQKEYQTNNLYGLKRSEKELEILLDSQSIYSQFVGVVLARQLPRPLSLELVHKIKQRASESKRVSDVALVTLSLKAPDEYSTYLEILSEADKRCH